MNCKNSYLFLLIFTCFFTGNNSSAQTVTTNLDTTIQDITSLDIGFNRRSDNGTWWTDASFQNVVSDMNPDIVRYPGGTQANYWDWREGRFLENTDKSWGNKEILKIPQFVNALPTRTKIIYVVNLTRPTPTTGISVNASEAILKSDATLQLKITDMIAALDEFVAQGKEPYAVEIGNEFYFGNIESGIFEIKEINGQFYSGWDEANNQPYVSATKKDATDITAAFYLKQCKTIVEQIKAAYPNIKFALVTTKVGNGNSARERWNNTIFDQLENNATYTALKNDIYAVTQHHYLNTTYGVQTTITDNASAEIAISEGIQYPIDKQSDYNLVPNDYKIWITEFGEVKEIAEETWASAVRYAAFVYGWLNLGDKIDQMEWHYISDNNVVNDNNNPMILAPVGIGFKLFSLASADMTQMQKITFNNNPTVVNNVPSLFGYKFSNAEKETLLIINISDTNFSQVQFNNLFTYTGQPTMTQYYSNTPYVTNVFDGNSNITSNMNTVNNSTAIPNFSITVIEAESGTLAVEEIISDEIKLYPNPTASKIHIQTNKQLESIAIYDRTGKLIQKSDIISQNTIRITDLQAGIYFITIETTEGIITKKLIKK
ncbi:T9SS type A sorting domain-containing protein [uncultured Kordia sp.]|uniref:T9SS type A sorting domain-containing protein n=1 Tax=uncultured Kordia sp. TaxID=507699 RepID=UPI0026353B69|nr:T9SS type A sorting domain-containing protein [uncultured Kordia sp.]